MSHGSVILLHNSLGGTLELAVAVQWMHSDLSKGQEYYSHQKVVKELLIDIQNALSGQ